MYTMVNFFQQLPGMYGDSQNYVYNGKFFLSRPLAVEKRGKIWKNLFELNKQVNIRKSTLLDVK